MRAKGGRMRLGNHIVYVGLSLLCLGVVGCGGAEDDEGEPVVTEGIDEAEPPQVKYADPPVDPLDLQVDPEATLAGRLEITLRQGEFKRFVFDKRAGVRYTVGLTGLSGDLDLFGHYVRDLSRTEHQFHSWRYGTEDEQFDFTATQDGPYYILVHGYAAGRATLVLYTAEADEVEDEVQWPVDWARDEWTDRTNVGGGLVYLQSHDYGGSCGRTPHPGLDLNFGSGADDLGLPVFAVADGEVVESSRTSWGNAVRIHHRLSSGTEFWSLSGHLQERVVESGERVRRGQLIGTIGRTGTVSPHLHFELRRRAFQSAQFPCSQSAWQVEQNYFDPGEFIRRH